MGTRVKVGEGSGDEECREEMRRRGRKEKVGTGHRGNGRIPGVESS